MDFNQLVEKIKKSYENGVTMEEAERLAGEFLVAQIKVGEKLKDADLDARMRKTGVKAIKASVYMEGAAPADPKKASDFKKPSDVLLNAQVDLNAVVQKEQDELDKAEVTRDELKNLLSVFHEAHIHFRSIAKGSFSG
jgi:hypothetical protein